MENIFRQRDTRTHHAFLPLELTVDQQSSKRISVTAGLSPWTSTYSSDKPFQSLEAAFLSGR